MKTVELAGTEKQINFANSLIADLFDRIELFERKGKSERVANEIMVYDAIQDGTEAGKVIDVLNGANYEFSLSSVKMDPERCRIEKTIEYLKNN